MSIRKFKFINGDFYHIFNRGVDKRDIFMDHNDINRFFKSMEEFNTISPVGGIHKSSFLKNKELRSKASKLPRLVDFICYCLNPNHFHFILKQVSDRGIERFMQRLGTGYTKYFNFRNNRSGSLFQGKFKAVYLPSDSDQLLNTSVYVNLNYKVHGLVGSIYVYKSSFSEYINNINNNFCKKNIILNQFKNKEDYKKFAENLFIDIKRKKNEKKEIDKLLFE